MADIARLIEIVEPEAQALGFELVRVIVFGKSEVGDEEVTLQVMAERPETGQLVIEDCAALSHRISDAMDALEEAGEVLIEGKDIVTADGAERQEILTRFGVMYQQGALFGSMNLLENVRLFLEEYTDLTPDEMSLISRCKLDLVGLLPFESFMPSEISGGMQKRAAIARAMALDPDILFLDEPSAGLDPITSAELDQTILSISRNLGITFVVVTHELPSIYTIADRVIMLDKETKGIIAEGKPQWLRDNSEIPLVRQFFNRDAHAPGATPASPTLPTAH